MKNVLKKAGNGLRNFPGKFSVVNAETLLNTEMPTYPMGVKISLKPGCINSKYCFFSFYFVL